MRRAFFDLNVTVDPKTLTDGDIRQFIEIYVELGYRCIALNVNVTGRVQSTLHGCHLRGKTDALLAQISEEKGWLIQSSSPQLEYPVQVVHRITIIAQDAADLYALQSSPTVPQSYDIVAVEPGNEKLLQQAMQLDGIDLISVPLGRRAPFQIKRTHVKMCESRGLMIELCLAPLMSREASARRYALQNGMLVASRTGGGHRCVLTSGASRVMATRAPLDLANLSITLLGVSNTLGMAAVSAHAEHVVRHGQSRRLTGGKGVMIGVKVSRGLHEAYPEDKGTLQE